ncbi:MAG: hypothetical protein KJ072_09045 [Verrucomicrobia bacterium]|nr:hypothetical protein [Verrucomicrobiota bacterium]
MAGLFAASGIGQESNPRFANAWVSDSGFVMQLAGIGTSCVLEATEDLLAPWIEVTLPEPLADGELEVPVDLPKQFFRIRCGEVYSENGAGFLQIEMPAGISLIANPFDSGGNTLAEVLGEAWTFGTTVYRFDASQQAYTATQFGDGAWLDGDLRLPLGTGSFIQVATQSTLVLGGVFDDSTTDPELAGGWNLVGSPAATVPEEGDQIVILAADNSYQYYTFEFGGWEPAEPPVRLGQGFWYYRNRPGSAPAGGSLLFSNFGPSMAWVFGAPQFDHVGCPWEGTNGFAQLYAGPDAGELAGVGEPVTFLSGGKAGFFDSGSNAVRYVASVAPGGPAVVEIRMWNASGGATYEEALANGGAHGTSAPFQVPTGGAGDPPSLPAGLTGLTSSGGLGGIWLDVSGGGIHFVGDTARLTATHDYVTSRTETYQWQRGIPDEPLNDWVNVDGATGPVLELSPLRFEDAGHYRVLIQITGCAGSGQSLPIELKVLKRPSFSSPAIDLATGAFRFVFEGESTLDYAIDYSSNFVDWYLLRTFVKPVGPVEVTDTEAPGTQQRLYRARTLPF